ncbi:MAG TPA: hypothetical protein VFX70_15555 [Mycobacteriales bacterium]|nr:hypothetical protein [Mycobacteriales bacterium]
MFDHVQMGWLESDDYRAAVEVAGVVELADSAEPAEPADPAGEAPADDDRAGSEAGTADR